MTSTPRTGQLPQWLLPFEHAGRCYDQIGALSVGIGSAASVALTFATSAVGALVTGDGSPTVAEAMPDPAAAGVAMALGGLFTAFWRLWRHLLVHRAVVDHQGRRLDALIDAINAGRVDPAELPAIRALLVDLGVDVDGLPAPAPVLTGETVGPVRHHDLVSVGEGV